LAESSLIRGPTKVSSSLVVLGNVSKAVEERRRKGRGEEGAVQRIALLEGLHMSHQLLLELLVDGFVGVHTLHRDTVCDTTRHDTTRHDTTRHDTRKR
jgi:hypothetical protein